MSRSFALPAGILVGLLAGLGAGLLLQSDDAPLSTAGSGRLDPRVTNIVQQIDDIADRQAAIEDELAEVGSAATPAGPTGPEAPSNADGAAAAVAEEAAIAERLTARMETEGTDPSWSTAAEEKAQGWLQDVGADVVSAQCGTSVCRVVVAYPDAASRDAGMQALPLSEPWSAPGFARSLGGDQLQYEVFLAREGQSLDG